MFIRTAVPLPLLLSIVCLFPGRSAISETPVIESRITAAQIAEHVRRLDDDEPTVRKQASEAIISAGADALPALCAANRSTESVELRESTKYLILKIEYDRFRKPRLYSLRAEGERFNDVLLKLALLSGARIVSYPDRINDVPISVNMRDKPFWEIVLELCRLSRNHLSAVEPYDAHGDFRILRGPQRPGTFCHRGRLIAFSEGNEFREQGPVRSDLRYLAVSVVPEPGFQIELGARTPFAKRTDYDFREGVAMGCNIVTWYKDFDGVGRATILARHVTGAKHLFEETVDLDLTLPVYVLPNLAPARFATTDEGAQVNFFGGTSTIAGIEKHTVGDDNILELDVHSEWHPLLSPYSISVFVSQGGLPLNAKLVQSTWQIDQCDLSVRCVLPGDQPLEISVLASPRPTTESLSYRLRRLKL